MKIQLIKVLVFMFFISFSFSCDDLPFGSPQKRAANLVTKAKKSIYKGDSEKALKLLTRSLELYSKHNPKAYVLKAGILADKGKNDEALNLLKKCKHNLCKKMSIELIRGKLASFKKKKYEPIKDFDELHSYFKQLYYSKSDEKKYGCVTYLLISEFEKDEDLRERFKQEYIDKLALLIFENSIDFEWNSHKAKITGWQLAWLAGQMAGSPESCSDLLAKFDKFHSDLHEITKLMAGLLSKRIPRSIATGNMEKLFYSSMLFHKLKMDIGYKKDKLVNMPFLKDETKEKYSLRDMENYFITKTILQKK